MRDSSPRRRSGARRAGRLVAVHACTLLAACAPARPPLWPPAACAATATGPAAAPAARGGAAHPTRNVILVALDGARWQEVFLGVDPRRARAAGLAPDEVLDARRLLPSFQRHFLDGGVALGAPGVGAPVVASGPEFVSLPGYLEMLTGRAQPGCTHNRCAPVATPTLLDDLRERLGPAPSQVALIASWDRLERAASVDGKGLAISTGRHAGPSRDRVRVDACASQMLDAAAAADAAPGHGDYRTDRYTAALALRYLAVARPRFLFVGLGDTDEQGHRGSYRGYLESLRRVDGFVGELFATLAALGDYGDETTVLVTADHGWADDFSTHGSAAPESARVWLLAAGGAVRARGPVPAAAPRRLADLAPTIRALLGLPADGPGGGGAPADGRPIPELLDAATVGNDAPPAGR